MKRRTYSHIDKTGIKMMEEIRPGALLRVTWIEDPEADAEWVLDMIYFDEPPDLPPIVMLIEWMPYVNNAKNIITFKCLYEDKLYHSSTNALVEVIK